MLVPGDLKKYHATEALMGTPQVLLALADLAATCVGDRKAAAKETLVKLIARGDVTDWDSFVP